MANEVLAATITMGSVIGAVYLTYSLGRADQKKTTAALADTHSDLNRLEATANDLPTNIRRPLQSTREDEEFDRPFDTSISYAKTTDALLFRIPPKFGNVFGLTFLFG